MKRKHDEHIRAAKQTIRETAYSLKHIPADALPYVAKGFAEHLKVPPRIMLKAMARYVRLHHPSSRSI